MPTQVPLSKLPDISRIFVGFSRLTIKIGPSHQWGIQDSRTLRHFRPALITYRHPFLGSDKSGDLQGLAHDQSIWPGTRLHSILIRYPSSICRANTWIETSGRTKEHSRRRRKEWRTLVVTEKEVVYSSKFQNILLQTQLYFSFFFLLFYWLEHLWKFLELCRNF
jgi:hypothetical protein